MKTEVDALEALKAFYKGATLGVWEGDLIRNEKKRGIFLPTLLQEFLEKYGLLNVNRGINQLWLPDKIDEDTAKVGDELREILIVGKFRENLVAILKDDVEQENPILLLDDLPEENGDEVTLVFHKSEMRLMEFLMIMLVESPSVYDNARVFGGDKIQEALEELDEKSRAEIEKLLKGNKRPARKLYWDEEQRSFIVLIMTEEQTVLLEFAPCLSIRELEDIFAREFYENAENCDYAYALEILRSLIDYWNQVGNAEAILADKYKLAGRCCWAMKAWMEAEDYYKRAEELYKKTLGDALEKSVSFYEGLGNFYAAREDFFKSQSAFSEVDRLCEFARKNSPRYRGERMMRQGMLMMEATRYEQAVEIYDRALEEFQRDPKDCKYDIARCQQLRGEARKAIKERGERNRNDMQAKEE